MNHDSPFTMAMMPARARQRKRQAARARILEAARHAVARNGWRDAQIALIAHRADVATGSVYRHFDSKAELYAEVLAMVSEREIAVVAAIVDSGGPAAQRLVDAIYMFCLRAMRARQLAYALIAEPCEPEIDRARLKYRAALAEQIRTLVAEGIEQGEFIDIDARLAASCITGAFMEALVGPLAPEAAPGSRNSKELARSMAALAARMVFRQAAPRLKAVSRGLR